MSFRNTFVTEFLYKADLPEEIRKIENALSQYGSVTWTGHDGLGYFHGVIKDLDGFQTKSEEKEIVEALEKVGCRIKIVLE
jgi:hypothetical protein